MKNKTIFIMKTIKRKLVNFVPHCPEALRYAKVWGGMCEKYVIIFTMNTIKEANPTSS